MDELDILKLKSELIYKKIIVLLAIAGGSGAYTVRFYEHSEYGIALFFLFIFLIFGFGVAINYQEINKIKRGL